ncbi:MAG: iron ABC transporter permease [Candidatus Binatia bacterium]
MTPGFAAASAKTLLGPVRRHIDVWWLGVFVIAALVATPLLTVIALAFTPADDIWHHLASTVLPHYVKTTVALSASVGFGTFVIGTATAWLVTLCRFPGRRLFEWALLLPMAVPAYVIAYVYTDVLEYAGPVQGALRDVFGWSSSRDYWFPQIRSLGGAVTMMTLVLYPYVYLLARAAFLEQSVCVLEVSRTLGRGPWRSFFTVALPLARPAIVIGISLVIMETLNDLGTVDFFAVSTFTRGIYDVWLNMNSVSGAAQLASVLLLFVFGLIALERTNRRKQRFHHTTTKYRPLPGYHLGGWRGIGAAIACLLPILLGFAVPCGVLLKHAIVHFEDAVVSEYLVHTINSLTLSSLAAAVTVGLGLFLAYGLRISGDRALRGLTRFAAIGYAIPGAVLAVGVLHPLGRFDNAIDAFSREAFGFSTGLLFSGTVIAITVGYVVRFLALSVGTLEASLAKITPSMDAAARTLGVGPAATLRRVHLPIMRASILTAGVLVFVDCMKELPMTLIMRPFNFETLATHVYQLASRELLEQSALGSLTIVVAGILPVLLVSLAIGRSRPGQQRPEG